MQIDNTSTTPTRMILRAMEIIEPNCMYSCMARLVVQDNDLLRMTAGFACRVDEEEIDYVRPSLVILELAEPKARKYPKIDQYKRAVGKIELRSFQEEILLVLAHEFRHIDQFWRFKRSVDTVHQAEIDAESFAVGLLNASRNV